ncbi:MAG: PHP domain-containing protein [Gemmatimonas sp.]
MLVCRSFTCTATPKYSLLDGANRIEDLIKRAQHYEMPALAITDHGNMHAAWEFQEKAKKGRGEAHSRDGSVCGAGRPQSSAAGPAPGVKPYYHLVLARPRPRRATRISSSSRRSPTPRASTPKPRIDRELLAKYSEGLIVIVGVHGGRGGRPPARRPHGRGAQGRPSGMRMCSRTATTSRCRRTPS